MKVKELDTEKLALLNKGLTKTKQKLGDFDDDDANKVCYRTFFPSIDMYTGKNVEVAGEIRKIRGFRDGWCVTYTGPSHSGKTALAVQIAANIVRPFPESSHIEYISTEDAQDEVWLSSLTGFKFDPEARMKKRKGDLPRDEFEARVKVTPSSASSTGYLQETIEAIYDTKVNNPDVYAYEDTAISGQKVTKYVPTVVVVDSYSQLVDNTLLAKEELSEMFHAQKALKNKNMLYKIKGKCRKANILLFFIAHKGEKIQTGYAPDPKAWRGMSNKEAIKMDKQAQYESDFILDLKKYSYPKEDKIGAKIGASAMDNTTVSHAVQTVIIKNRAGSDNVSLNLAFVKERGFDPLLSILTDIYDEHKFIKSTGTTTKMDNWDEKLNKPKVIKELMVNPEFRAVFASNLEKAFESHLVFKPSTDLIKDQQSMLASML